MTPFYFVGWLAPAYRDIQSQGIFSVGVFCLYVRTARGRGWDAKNSDGIDGWRQPTGIFNPKGFFQLMCPRQGTKKGAKLTLSPFHSICSYSKRQKPANFKDKADEKVITSAWIIISVSSRIFPNFYGLFVRECQVLSLPC